MSAEPSVQGQEPGDPVGRCPSDSPDTSPSSVDVAPTPSVSSPVVGLPVPQPSVQLPQPGQDCCLAPGPQVQVQESPSTGAYSGSPSLQSSKPPPPSVYYYGWCPSVVRDGPARLGSAVDGYETDVQGASCRASGYSHTPKDAGQSKNSVACSEYEQADDVYTGKGPYGSCYAAMPEANCVGADPPWAPPGCTTCTDEQLARCLPADLQDQGAPSACVGAVVEGQLPSGQEGCYQVRGSALSVEHPDLPGQL